MTTQTMAREAPASQKQSASHRSVAHLFLDSAERYAENPAFATREGGHFQMTTYAQLREQAESLATALIDLGLKPRDHVGIFAENRIEWIQADLAVLLAGAADVPRGADVTDPDIRHIVPHSGMRFLFVENTTVLEKMRRHPDLIKNVTLILMSGQDADVYAQADLIRRGRELRHQGDRRVEEHMAGLSSDDLFTLIYTSGTTGAPKGVMLTHANMLSQLERIPVPIRTDDRVVSILPVWHIFERVFEMIALARGCCTYYSNVRSLRDDMKSVQPTFMASAPRLWESVYSGILANLEKASPVRRGLFALTLSVSRRFRGALRFLKGNELDITGRSSFLSMFRALWSIVEVLLLAVPFFLLDRIVLKKIRAATGGALRGTCSGGGALPYHVDLFFNDAGIPVLEGYGLTETSPVLSVRTPDLLVPGTVGPIYPDTDLRITDLNTGELLFTTEAGGPKRRGVKGEIHVKGPQVMKGYYKDQAATDKVLKDGWFNTGDLGMMTYNDCLKITGRSKETIVLLNGENVEPVPIENTLLQSPYIRQLIVVGQDKKYLTALIVPEIEKFPGHKEFTTLAIDPEALSVIRDEVKRLISAEQGFKSFEKVVDFRLLPKPFEQGDELTGKLSVKRHVVTERYAKLIESMYE